jgi:hypothetical protein
MPVKTKTRKGKKLRDLKAIKDPKGGRKAGEDPPGTPNVRPFPTS